MKNADKKISKNKELLKIIIIFFAVVATFFIPLLIFEFTTKDVSFTNVSAYETEIDGKLYIIETYESDVESIVLSPYTKHFGIAIYDNNSPYTYLGRTKESEEIEEIIRKPYVIGEVNKINNVTPKKNKDNLYVEELECKYTTNDDEKDTYYDYRYFVYTSSNKEKLIAIFRDNRYYQIKIKKVQLLYSDDNNFCLRINDYFVYKSNLGYGQEYLKKTSKKEINSLIEQVKSGELPPKLTFSLNNE